MMPSAAVPPNAAPGPGPAAFAGSRPVAPVFSFPTFALCAAGILPATSLALYAQLFFGDRLGLGGPVATGLAVLVAVLWVGGAGFGAAAAGQRLGFYEIVASTLLLLGLHLYAWNELVHGRILGPLLSLAGQPPQIVLIALILSALITGAAAFVGASVSYLLFGSGRFDPSLSYELFVARSHLRLHPRTLAGLFGVVVTGVLPGLLGMIAVSFIDDVRAREAERRGDVFARQRLPATLLMTLISIGGVSIGVWALCVVLSVMSGFEADLKKKILGTNAHAVVMKYGQNDFTDWKETMAKVKKVRDVVGLTPFLLNEVMISNDQNLQGVVVKGIDPATVGSVTDLRSNIQEGEGNLDFLDRPEDIPEPSFESAGKRAIERALDQVEKREKVLDHEKLADPRFPEPDKSDLPQPKASKKERKLLPGIVIGRELARSLKVYVGDTVNVISPLGDLGPTGPQPKSRPYRVAAIFFSGMYEYDSKFAYLQLKEAQRFFGAGESVTGIEVKVADVDRARPISRRILTELEGYPFRTKDWGEMNRNLFSALMMEKVVMAVILGFIVLVASFIIIATLIMLVLEKTKEIAVLKSMGAAQPSVMKIFVVEGLAIGAIGTLMGLLLGFGTCLAIDKIGIPLDPEVYYISNLPVLVEGQQFFFVALTAMVLSYLATIYPATKASRLEPVEGLRAE